MLMAAALTVVNNHGWEQYPPKLVSAAVTVTAAAIEGSHADKSRT